MTYSSGVYFREIVRVIRPQLNIEQLKTKYGLDLQAELIYDIYEEIMQKMPNTKLTEEQIKTQIINQLWSQELYGDGIIIVIIESDE